MSAVRIGKRTSEDLAEPKGAAFPRGRRVVRSRGKRTKKLLGVTSVDDPNVWSGRAVQEVLSILVMRSCINVSGL